jgi:hypothetical protein
MAVTRRNLLLGSAAVFGTLAAGAAPAAAARPHRRLPSTPVAVRQRVAFGFRLPGGLTCPVPYMSRAAWGADESWRYSNGVEDWPTEHFPAQALTVHHTGFATSLDPAETVRTIYRQQALTPARGGIKGWGDIGYNLLIDEAGVVYEGRYSGSSYPVLSPAGLMATAAHVQNFNTGNIGVCLLGYLNDAPPSAAAQDSLVTVLAYLAAVVGVNPLGTVSYYNPIPRTDGSHATATVAGISGHRNWAATDCPGHALYPLLGGIRQRVASAMPTAPEPPQSTEASQPSASAPSSPQPDGSAQPSASSTSEPQASGPATTSATQNPMPTKTTGSARSERGGDEYVAAARTASPSQFPTVKPVPSASAVPVASATSTPGLTPTPMAPPVVPVVSAEGGPGWGFGAPAIGLAVAGVVGSLGGWWWRHHRTATRASTATPTVTVTADSEMTAADVESTANESPSAEAVDVPADGLLVRPPAVEPSAE